MYSIQYSRPRKSQATRTDVCHRANQENLRRRRRRRRGRRVRRAASACVRSTWTVALCMCTCTAAAGVVHLDCARGSMSGDRLTGTQRNATRCALPSHANIYASRGRSLLQLICAQTWPDRTGPDRTDGRRRCGLAEQALAVAVWPTAAFVLVLARHETSI